MVLLTPYHFGVFFGLKIQFEKLGILVVQVDFFLLQRVNLINSSFKKIKIFGSKYNLCLLWLSLFLALTNNPY
jgi:hypothetical protein